MIILLRYSCYYLCCYQVLFYYVIHATIYAVTKCYFTTLFMLLFMPLPSVILLCYSCYYLCCYRVLFLNSVAECSLIEQNYKLLSPIMCSQSHEPLTEAPIYCRLYKISSILEFHYSIRELDVHFRGAKRSIISPTGVFFQNQCKKWIQ